ncbi:MAG: hypothetical protein CMF96_00395 [Candidatus Marinimicrobia bacterium]|nr:hypothetical protein [Candidatus Neomarinimicrobiota bacterium]
MNVENTYSNKLDNNLIFNILYKRNDNRKYITKNIKKISKIKPEKILYKKLDNNLNKFIYDSLNKNNFDILVIYNKKQFNYTFNFTPLYPIVIKKDEEFNLIITAIQAELLNGFNVTCNNDNDFYNDFLFRVNKLYGGVISNKNISNFNLFEDSLNGFKELYRDGIFKKYNINNIKNTKHIIEYEHGWLSESTKINLEYAIKKKKPKIIVELGTWLGSSTKFMKKIDPNVIIFCFDIFQPILHTNYKFDKYSPIDNFYFSIPRIETFHKNMSACDQVYSVMTLIEIDQIINFLKLWSIEVDLFYIDFEKKTYYLNKVLSVVMNKYPNSIIVGDDFGFDSVKESIYTQLLILDKKFAIAKESYIISNEIMNDYGYIIKKHFKNEKKEKNILKFINKKISDLDIKYIEKKEYVKTFINKCLELGNFNLLLNFFKYYKIDLNSQEYTINKMTIYHILSKYLRIFKKTEKIKDFYKYQKPSNKKDIFFLKYDDYLNFNINFS